MTTTTQPIINTMMQNQAVNPVLAPGTTMTPAMMQANDNEMQTAPQLGTAPTVTATTAGTTQATATQGTATTAGPAQTVNTNPYLQQAQNAQASQMQAHTIGQNTPQMQVTQDMTMRGQMEQMMDFDGTETPDWAKGAVKRAEQVAAARGVGSSTMGAEMVAGALLEAAMPIAAQTAQTHFAAASQNMQARLQTMLSDQGFINAARQFNAQSQQQHTQFFTSLLAGMDQFNAAQKNAMSQFNANLQTSVSMQNAQNETQVSLANASESNAQDRFNAEQITAVQQFNAQLQNQREQFNVQNQMIVDQSNVEWRRQINTANTAAINTANQINAQNRFNMSQTAMNNLWQAARDEAHWAFQSSENAQNRAYNMAMAALDRQHDFSMLNETQKNEFYQTLGNVAIEFLRGF